MDDYARAFKLIDSHVRAQHQCFVAEMFLGPSQHGYITCFRPCGEISDSESRYACRYLEIPIAEVNRIASSNRLDETIREMLDRELLTLGSKK